MTSFFGSPAFAYIDSYSSFGHGRSCSTAISNSARGAMRATTASGLYSQVFSAVSSETKVFRLGLKEGDRVADVVDLLERDEAATRALAFAEAAVIEGEGGVTGGGIAAGRARGG